MGITISCWPTCFQLKEGGIASAVKKSFAKHYHVLIQAHGTIGNMLIYVDNIDPGKPAAEVSQT